MKQFVITAKNEFLLKAMWKDLMELGYIDDSQSIIWNGITTNWALEQAASLEMHKQICHDYRYLNGDKVEFHLPEQYNDALKFAKQALKEAEEKFTPKFEKGKWYVSISGISLGQYLQEEWNVGFLHEDWVPSGIHMSQPKKWREATNTEIKNAFEKYAKARYKDGCTIQRLIPELPTKIEKTIEKIRNFDVHIRNDGSVWINVIDANNQNRLVFDSKFVNEWAKVVEKRKEPVKTLYFGTVQFQIHVDEGYAKTKYGKVTKEEVDRAIEYIENPPCLIDGEYPLTIYGKKTSSRPLSYLDDSEEVTIGFGCEPGSVYDLRKIQKAFNESPDM